MKNKTKKLVYAIGSAVGYCAGSACLWFLAKVCKEEKFEECPCEDCDGACEDAEDSTDAE